ncbi:hypothetical protein ACSS6W_001951 [Trichoderma asperelloides]
MMPDECFQSLRLGRILGRITIQCPSSVWPHSHKGPISNKYVYGFDAQQLRYPLRPAFLILVVHAREAGTKRRY